VTGAAPATLPVEGRICLEAAGTEAAGDGSGHSDAPC
jgi:hypothetical protein